MVSGALVLEVACCLVSAALGVAELATWVAFWPPGGTAVLLLLPPLASSTTWLVTQWRSKRSRQVVGREGDVCMLQSYFCTALLLLTSLPSPLTM